MTFRKTYTPQQAYPKIKHYCSYQERSHAEVKEKLYGFGLRKTEVEELISKLIEENYLNEERFSESFARGHFRMKQWGKVKIKYELKQKQVSEYNIQRALSSIEEEEYLKTLKKLAETKWKSIKTPGVNVYTRLAKTTSYLMQKGYEPVYIKRILTEIKAPEDKP
jgi:regulatory protein